MTSLILVRGPSAAGLLWVGRALYAALLTPLVFCGLVMFGLSQVWPSHKADTSETAITLILAACGVTASILVLSFVLSPIQERRETARGYTSMRTAHRELPEVLAGTTWIIRQGGAEYLTNAEWSAKEAEAASTGIRPMTQGALPSSLLLVLQGGVAVAFSILVPWLLFGYFAPLWSLVSIVVLSSVFVGVFALIRLAKGRTARVSQ